MKPSAETAIEVIKTVVEQLGTEYAAFLAFPNVVLTLSGARAEADGVFYSHSKTERQTWLSELELLFENLRKFYPIEFFTIDEAVNPIGEPYVSYDFLTKEGIANLSTKTGLLPDGFKPNCHTPDEFFDSIFTAISKNPTLQNRPKELINHVAQGVLLGYPDKAILSMVDYWQSENDDPFAPRPIEADIRGADYYQCPQPIYDYPRALVNDPQIKAHEQLWNKILHDFYTSEFFQKLEKDPKFSKKIQQLTQF